MLCVINVTSHATLEGLFFTQKQGQAYSTSKFHKGDKYKSKKKGLTARTWSDVSSDESSDSNSEPETGAADSHAYFMAHEDGSDNESNEVTNGRSQTY